MAQSWKRPLAILDKYFCKVVKLKDYISHGQVAPFEFDEDENFHAFLDQILVAGRCDHQFYAPEEAKVRTSMVLLLQRVIMRFCQKDKERDNLVCLGFTRLKNESSSWGFNCQMDHPNTLIMFLQHPNWNRLLKACGDSVLLHLLTYMSLFVKLPFGCLLQITGRPLHCVESKRSCNCVHTTQSLDTQHKFSSEQTNQVAVPSESRLSFTHKVTEHRADRQEGASCSRNRSAAGCSNDLKQTENEENYTRIKRNSDTHQANTFQTAITASAVYSEIKYIQQAKDEKNAEMDSDSPSGCLSDLERIWQTKFNNSRADGVTPTAVEEAPISFPLRDINEADMEAGQSSCHEKQAAMDKSAKSSRRKRRKRASSNDNGANFYKTSEDEYLGRPFIFYSPSSKEGFPNHGTLSSVKPNNKGAYALSQEIFKIQGNAREPNKIPKSYRRASKSIKKLIANHQRLKISVLLRIFCGENYSIKTKYRRLDKDPPVKRAIPQDASPLNIATQSHIPLRKVFLFLRAVCTKVIPKEVWGSASNKNTFLRHLFEYVALGRQENMTLSELLYGLKVTKCRWLLRRRTKSVAEKLPHSQYEWMRRNVALFFLWFMKSYIAPLLRGCFYVTTADALKSRVVYYTKRMWRVIQKEGVAQLEHETYQEVSSESVELFLDQCSTLGVSKLRLVPKKGRVRPIVNMNKRPKQGSLNSSYNRWSKVMDWKSFANSRKQDYGHLSINQKLTNVHICLQQEVRNNPALLGASVLTLNSVYSKLKAFKLWTKSHSKNAALHYAVLDLSSCFDRIDQNLLGEIISECLKGSYIIGRFVTVKIFNDKVCTDHKKCVKSSEHGMDAVQFYGQMLTEGKLKLRNAVIVDKVFCLTESSHVITTLLEQHVNRNLVQVNGRYLQQSKGVPQGSVLSSLLCNLYLGALENAHFKDLLHSSETLLMRWMDDYLLLTYSEEKAKLFIQTMLSGVRKYNFQVNPDKLVTNAPSHWHPLLQGKNKELYKCVHWIGLRLDLDKLEVGSNYERYCGKHISAAVSRLRPRHPGLSMKTSLVRISLTKCNLLILSPCLNSTETVLINMYQAFIYTAKAFHFLVSKLNKGKRLVLNANFLLTTITDTMTKFSTCYERRCATDGVKGPVSKHECHALFIHAFRKCLRRKQGKYKELLPKLTKYCTRHCKRLPQELLDLLNERSRYLNRINY